MLHVLADRAIVTLKTGKQEFSFQAIDRTRRSLLVGSQSNQGEAAFDELWPYDPKLLRGEFLENAEKKVLDSDKILWTDEAIFKLSGHVNRHNITCWSNANPRQTLE
ncbi:hypothetical protein M514_11705 [Trichuris suis]|uniref:Uncharacterized protein n=1 Tax=Trichuris suis TaxID=68888 RepID=A0A085LR40_9BILA|nr:hypothetical protein M513_11705 [Trichuris suis]KFD67166.1 hypothetical protein M514_11705 [Trichuris suis]